MNKGTMKLILTINFIHYLFKNRIFVIVLILLDIDGVMVTTPSWKKVELLNDNFSTFNQRAADNLQRLISETNASVVLTTSHKSSFTISQWKSIFKNRGINVNSIDCLDNNVSHLSRKDEILNWFNNKGIEESFVIIDDDKSLNDLPHNLKDKCVITSSLIGLNDEAVLNAINILNTQELAVA
jgi:hypothetical protein